MTQAILRESELTFTLIVRSVLSKTLRRIKQGQPIFSQIQLHHGHTITDQLFQLQRRYIDGGQLHCEFRRLGQREGDSRPTPGVCAPQIQQGISDKRHIPPKTFKRGSTAFRRLCEAHCIGGSLC